MCSQLAVAGQSSSAVEHGSCSAHESDSTLRVPNTHNSVIDPVYPSGWLVLSSQIPQSTSAVAPLTISDAGPTDPVVVPNCAPVTDKVTDIVLGQGSGTQSVPLRPWPLSQDVQMAPWCDVQSVRLAACPSLHVHTLSVQTRSVVAAQLDASCFPASHVAHCTQVSSEAPATLKYPVSQPEILLVLESPHVSVPSGAA